MTGPDAESCKASPLDGKVAQAMDGLSDDQIRGILVHMIKAAAPSKDARSACRSVDDFAVRYAIEHAPGGGSADSDEVAPKTQGASNATP